MEVCADRLDSVAAAAAGGAARVELCASLAEGGLTPTVGALRAAKRVAGGGVEVFALVRPRGGDFLYSREELEAMEDDIGALRDAGADGFVLGCLTEDGDVDKEVKKGKLKIMCIRSIFQFFR